MRRVIVFLIVIVALAAGSTVVAACGTDSTSGAPIGAENRQGVDRFIGSWRSADHNAPVVVIEKVGDTFKATLVRSNGDQLSGATNARSTGTVLLFDADGQGAARLHLRDADHVIVTGPGARIVWHAANVVMQRFSYGP